MLRRLAGYWRLLRRDPEAFGRALMQVTHPALFQARLEDLPPLPPLALRPDASRAGPRLSLLLQSASPQGLTGGPNTALNLALRIARHGIKLRLLQTQREGGMGAAALQRHLAALAGGPVPEMELGFAGDPARPALLGPAERLMATHWSTAEQLRPWLAQLPGGAFLYLIQDYEPGFHAWSSQHALALGTYGLPCWPICNSSLLARHLLAQHPGLAARLEVFEPAVEAALFHPAPVRAPRPRRLLFYARPSNPRNLYGLGLAALRQVAAEPTFAGWEMLAIGGRGGVPATPLGPGRTLRPAPWRDYAGYAALLREADILLAPMLSPHPGYPVLEMAASGGIAVTNGFGPKDAAALAALSPAIIAAAPSVEGFAVALREAAGRVAAGWQPPALALPGSWDAALEPLAGRLAAQIRG